MSRTEFETMTVSTIPKPPKIDTGINLERNAIRYYLMPSLQHISAVKIVITLLRQAYFQHQTIIISKEYEYYLPRTSMLEIWKKIGDKVLDGVSQIPVPNRIRKTLSNIVDPIGLEIYQWIRVNEKILSDDRTWHHYLKTVAINCMDYLVWTSRGRIEYKGTAKHLLDAKQLSNNDQYYLACTYCLEDDIAIIAPKVIHTLDIKTREEPGMLYFWTCHVTGDFTELDKEIYFFNKDNSTDCSMNECLFEALIDDNTNHVAVKYIWDKLSKEEKSRRIVGAITQISNSDIKCFLLSQMSKEEQQEIFKTCASNILLYLLDDWLWGEYFFPTIHKMWNVITEGHFLYVLEAIVNKMDRIHECIEKYDHYRATFKELWQCAPKHLKEYVIELENGYRVCGIFFSLFSEKNKDIIQLLLFDCNYTQKKNLIFSGAGVNECRMLIAGNQWDLLEMFIEHTLDSEDDVNNFKQTLVNEAGRCTSVRFIQNKEWNKVERFEKWAFKSNDEIKEFRQGLTYCTICRDLLKSIVSKNRGDFSELQHFFDWCTLSDEERIMRLKAEIPQLHFVEVICNLIEKHKYELLEQILNWCFVNDQTKIDQFKQKICHDHFEILLLVVNLIKQDDHLQSLESFVRWCLTNEQQINAFKGWILHSRLGTVGVCVALLRQNLFQLADEFVNWCCNSSQTVIDDFKNQIMCYDDIDYVFKQYHHNNKMLAEVISWFNPSKETVKNFKEKYVGVVWFKDILPALNTYVQKRNL